MDSRHAERKRPAHCPVVERHNRASILHVTVCTTERRSVLADESTHATLRACWHDATAWLIGYYLIMPDHVHLFCAPGTWDRPSVASWVTYWRRMCTRHDPALKGIWQSDCWDTQMRDGEHYRRKLEYVGLNPVRAGLVLRTEDWPYQGHIADLPWI
ncbi:MAG: hypothetical protein HN742_04130 [Lentisphaerae bacterium]|nr:hypothetical protein [Lentisphaerota bacterium]MBT4822096.1 hypothetical protein [Lentisphaerota bacterium]MBT5604847.1 hypothetical protein [Lentisphaerota bacterium]MBT7054234.1 hypothetical protein [Lentisphaerota bacterium]MBT7841031.1 hypothetical protein [Lentisphaerota bacterium]